MNVRKLAYKNYMASFLLVLYIFVSFFSIQFHNHSSQSVLEDHSLVSALDDYSDDHSHDSSGIHDDKKDCFSCHYFQYASGIELDFFSYTWLQDILFAQSVFAYIQKFGGLHFHNQLLRGPPVA